MEPGRRKHTTPLVSLLFGLASFLQKTPNEVVRRHENRRRSKVPAAFSDRNACGRFERENEAV